MSLDTSTMRERIRSFQKEIIFSIIGIIFILICGFFFYRDLDSDLGGERIYLGKVSYRSKTTERQGALSMLWEGITDRQSLYDKDTIRTGEDSQVVIAFESGSNLDLGELSMVRLRKQKDDTEVQVVSGIVRLSVGDKGAPVTLDVEGKKVQLSRGRMRVAKTESGTEISIQNGSADIDGKPIKANSTVKIDDNGSLATTQRSIQLISPYDGTLIFAQESDSEVEFSWSSLKNQVDQKFSISLVNKTSGERTIDAVSPVRIKVAKGDYTWRVISASEESETYRFSVVGLPEVQALFPADETHVTYVFEAPTVSFAVLQNDWADDCKLVIISPLKSDEYPSRSNIFEAKLGIGEYRWKVDCRIAGSSNRVTSVERTLTVGNANDLKTPEFLEPHDGFAITGDELANRGLLFTWRSDPESREFEIQMLRMDGRADTNPSFDSNAKDIEVFQAQRNFLRLQDDLENGAYCFRVRVIKPVKSSYSNVRCIQVNSETVVSLILPKNRAEVEAGPVGFEWNCPPGGSCRLLVSNTPDFLKPTVVDTEFRNAAVTLTEGEYFWKAKALLHDGRILESAVRTLLVTPSSLKTPVLLSPAPGDRVDVTQTDRIHFYWIPTNADGYVFSLYRITRAGKTLVISRETKVAQVTLQRELSLVEAGEFIYTVSAYTNNPARKSVDGNARFSIFLLDAPRAPKPNTQDRQFIR